ncbi:MAG: class I SAM-dependent methyltransferase [Trebonia sp.]|uniref:class I SAM-dependent methyltransferase n=1 Tax=Trebonia sp. TaxID=2767075 RepID=UPI003BAF88EC
MDEERTSSPDQTAVRVALWRAMHVLVDPPPHVLEDEVGLRLAAPDAGWRDRPDMDPVFTSGFRAHVVARSRFIEDLVAAQAARAAGQYVLLGAGLDTFAQRRPDVAARLGVFEVDQPGPQAWKRRRLTELGYGVPDWLRLVPVDFEAGGSWRDEILDEPGPGHHVRPETAREHRVHVRPVPPAGVGRRQPQPHLVLEHVRRRVDQHVHRPPQRDPHCRLIR